jgi:hypothetical protein
MPSGSMPARLVAVRPGGHVPASRWDAVFLRSDGRQAAWVSAELARIVAGLRHGGVAAVLALSGPPPDAASMLAALGEYGSPVEARTAEDGPWIGFVRKATAGRQDLVGLRRCIRALARGVDRLELMLVDVRGRAGSERSIDGGWSLKECVGHLGDLDRHGYLAAMRHALEGGPAPAGRAALSKLVDELDHESRPLAELVVRFRHLRCQSQEWLDRLGEEDWLTPAQDLDGHPGTLAEMVRSWMREEDAMLRRIEGMIG